MEATKSNFNVQTFVNGLTDRYEPYVREHLSKVYRVLGITNAAAAVGALLQMSGLLDLGVLAAVAGIVLLVGLIVYMDNGKNTSMRLSMLYALGFCLGQNLGPALGYTCSINPAIILLALTGTFVTFVTLSLVALSAKEGAYLFLGGMLCNAVSILFLLSLSNIILESDFAEMTELYVGLIVMAAYILYDTQYMVVECRNGNRDLVDHALNLFCHVISIFIKLLTILTKREEKKQKERRKRN